MMMKKVILVLGVLSSINLLAQKSFEKKTNVVAFGADLGIYNYVSQVAAEPKSTSNAAANKMLSLHYERGILNWLGAGAKVQLSDYFTSTDSVTHTKPSVKAIDITALVNAHFVRAKYVDMLAGFNIGYSNMNWEARDQAISSAKGGGLVYDLHLQPRFYFGKYVGMFINLAYVHYSYNNLDFKNTSTNLPGILHLNGGGVNFGIGLQGKF
jgi:Tfp pilus assembly major pilin PilA